MINGIVYDFESIKLQLPSGVVSSLSEIEYTQTKDVDVVTDTKGIPRGVVRKAFSGEFSMTMSLYEYELLSRQAGSRGILSMDPLPVVVSFAMSGAPTVTDTLYVKLTSVGRQIEKDGEVMVKVDGKQTAIPKFNSKPIYAASR